jgi:ATP-dependent exoDNAse (exonuclease V) beta subunit
MKTQQGNPFHREELDVIDLDTISIAGKRYYKTPDGSIYPSVTTVTSSTKKDYIEAWKKRVGEAEAAKVSRRASARGTDLHTICEQYTLNNPHYKRGMMPNIVEMFSKIKGMLDEHVGTIYANEIALFSHELKTAGRTDMFCQFQGINTIVDFKTSSKVKKESDIEDYFIQATTYAMMLEEMYQGKLAIPQLAIIMTVAEHGEPGLLFVKPTYPYRAKVRKLFAEYHEANPAETYLSLLEAN